MSARISGPTRPAKYRIRVGHDAMKNERDQFLSGVFSAMQYLVLSRGEGQLAAELAKENGIRQAWALKESTRTGFRVREMNRFIRQELPGGRNKSLPHRKD